MSNPWYAFVPRDGSQPKHAKAFLVNSGRVFVWSGRAGDEIAMARHARRIGLEVVQFEGRPYLDLTGVQAVARKFPDAGSTEIIAVSESFAATAAPLLKACRKLQFREIVKRVSPTCEAFLAKVEPWGAQLNQ